MICDGISGKHICFFCVMSVALMLHATIYAGKKAIFPLPVRLVLSKINPMIRNGEYERALKILETFQLQGDSGRSDSGGRRHPEIFFAKGNCHLMLAEYASAVTAYHHVVDRDTAHTGAWLNLAKAEYELDHYAEAGRGFEHAYQTSEHKQAEYLYYGAAAYLEAGDTEQAVSVFERLSASHADVVKPEWRESMMHALLTENKTRRALPHIQELIRIYSGKKQIQWQEILLYQYVNLDMLDEALKMAMALTHKAPDIPAWWKALAHIRLNAGQNAHALAALSVYAYLMPLSIQEKKLAADLYLQLGIPVKAVPIYLELYELKPDPGIVNLLVRAYQELGEPDKALICIEACEKAETDIELLLVKGELLYELKQYPEAVVTLEKAARKGGENAGRAWLMAGYSAMEANDLSASRNAFKNAAGYTSQKRAAMDALRHIDHEAIP